MKKSNIGYLIAAAFTIAFLVTVRYFDGEGATLFLIVALGAFGGGLYHFKLNR